MAKSPQEQKGRIAHPRQGAARQRADRGNADRLPISRRKCAPRPPKHYPRARPLPKGETRERDPDLDPQIVWNGVRITLTKAQAEQLSETGTVEIGDAQLVWRGKDRQDWSDLVVNVPMLYVQEKVHPKAIIDDLKRAVRCRSARRQRCAGPVRRFQWADRSRGARRVLSACHALAEPNDPGRQPAGDGIARRARGAEAARCSASISIHLMASSSSQIGRFRRCRWT